MKKTAVRVHVEFFRMNECQDRTQPLGDFLGSFHVQRLHVDYANSDLAALGELPAQLQLFELAAGELEHELIRARIENLRHHPAIGALAAGPPTNAAEADM